VTLRWLVQMRCHGRTKWWRVGGYRTRIEARTACRTYARNNPDDHWRVIDCDGAPQAEGT
jgi:hypothetical protein